MRRYPQGVMEESASDENEPVHLCRYSVLDGDVSVVWQLVVSVEVCCGMYA